MTEQNACEDVIPLAKQLENLNDVGRIAVNAFISGYNGGFNAAKGEVTEKGEN